MGFFIVLGILVVLGLIGFFGGRVAKAENPQGMGGVVAGGSVAIVVLLALVATACTSYTQVENGHIGMLKEFGALQDNPLEAGPHLKAPWASVDEVSVQVETRTYRMTNDEDGIGSAVSSDNQEVFMVVVVEHQLIEAGAVELYREVGPSFIEKKLDPAVPELTKRVTANYKAIDFAKNRAEIRAQIEALLQNEMGDVGIRVNKVSLKNVDFTDSFSAAIERTVEAEQNAKAATEQVKIREAEAKQAVATAEGAAQAAIAKARGDADATTLRARAEANRIRLEGQALRNNPELIKLRSIELLNPNVEIMVLPPDATLVQGLEGKKVVTP